MSDSQKTVARLVFTDRKVTPAINHTRFVQVIENLESHGIYYFDFQAEKVMEKQYAFGK